MLCLLVPLLTAFLVQEPALDDEPLENLGHPSALEIVGAKAISADDVHQALTTCGDFFEVSHPQNKRGAYRAWLKETTATAYQHTGFADVEVEVRIARHAGEVKVKVEEGPRLLAGEVQFENASTLDPEWVSAVLELGQVKPVCHEYLPAPPGPEPIYPEVFAITEDEPPTFWVPGEAARHSLEDRARFEELVVEAARASGLRAARISVRWHRLESNELIPIVTVEHEGPLATVREIRFEGEFEDPVDALLEWVVIPAGTAATEAVRLEAGQRLVATGRYGKADARFEAVEEEEGAYDLVIELEQVPVVPPLAEHPTEDLALMRRAIRRLEKGTNPQGGIDAELSLSPAWSRKLAAVFGAVGLPVALGDEDRLALHFTALQHFVALELSRASGDGTSTPLLRFAFDDRGGSLHLLPLGVKMHLPVSNWKVFPLVQAHYAKNAGKDGKHFSLGFSFVYDYSPRQRGLPVLLVQEITPTALLYLHGYLEAPESADPQQLVRTRAFDGGNVRASIDRGEARLLVECEIDKQGFEGLIRYGELDDVRPPAWATSPLEGDELESGAALGTTLRTMMEVMRAFKAEAGVESAWAKPEWLLVLAGLQAWASELFSAAPDERPEEDVTFVVRDEPSVTGEAEIMTFGRNMLELGALQVIERHETGSWPAGLARAMPVLVFPASREELDQTTSSIDVVGQDRTRGPLGTWLAAWMCHWTGQKPWAAWLAELGKDELSTDAFLVDCETLVGLGRGSPLEPVARAWRALAAEATGDSAEEVMVRETFEGLVAEDPDEAWLLAGLARIWEGALRVRVEERLSSYAEDVEDH